MLRYHFWEKAVWIFYSVQLNKHLYIILSRLLFKKVFYSFELCDFKQENWFQKMLLYKWRLLSKHCICLLNISRLWITSFLLVFLKKCFSVCHTFCVQLFFSYVSLAFTCVVLLINMCNHFWRCFIVLFVCERYCYRNLIWRRQHKFQHSVFFPFFFSDSLSHLRPFLSLRKCIFSKNVRGWEQLVKGFHSSFDTGQFSPNLLHVSQSLIIKMFV